MRRELREFYDQQMREHRAWVAKHGNFDHLSQFERGRKLFEAENQRRRAREFFLRQLEWQDGEDRRLLARRGGSSVPSNRKLKKGSNAYYDRIIARLSFETAMKKKAEERRKFTAARRIQKAFDRHKNYRARLAKRKRYYSYRNYAKNLNQFGDAFLDDENAMNAEDDQNAYDRFQAHLVAVPDDDDLNEMMVAVPGQTGKRRLADLFPDEPPATNFRNDIHVNKFRAFNDPDEEEEESVPRYVSGDYPTGEGPL